MLGMQSLQIEEDDNTEYDKSSMQNIGFTMSIYHKYYLVKALSGSLFLTKDQKVEMMVRVFGEDKSDSTQRYIQACSLRMPDHQTKMSVYLSITDLENNSPFSVFKEECSGFMQPL